MYFIFLHNLIYGTNNNVLIKASGDVIENSEFHTQCKRIADEITGKLVIICGAGRQINDNLKSAGYHIAYDDMGERIISCDIQEYIVRDTLKSTRDYLRNIFIDYQNIHVKGSWEEIGGIYCHINADTFVFTYYIGFEKIYLYTFPGNKTKKQKIFAKYPKVQIIEI